MIDGTGPTVTVRWMRTTIFCTLASLLLPSIGSAQSSPPTPINHSTNGGPASITQSPTKTDLNGAAQAQLDRRLPEINFNGNALGDVMDFLRDVSGANIFVNWKSLETVGIGRETPITVRLKGVKFSTVLSVILSDASGGPTKLAYTIDEGVIEIAAIGALPITLVTYDVTALLGAHPSYRGELTSKIIDAVDHDSWLESGGKSGMIKLDGGKLYVAQTQDNQKAVSKLLHNLQEESPESSGGQK
jgi:hypothetical protein